MNVKELEHPSAEQIVRMTNILTDAFWKTPLFYDYLFAGRKSLGQAFLHALVNYGIKAGRVFVAENEQGDIVACALWSEPTSPELGLGTYLQTGMWPQMLRIALQSPRAMRRINEMVKMLEHFAPETSCTTLEFLASTQKGAGAALVWGSIPYFSHRPLYVESIVHKNNHAFYRQFGFEPYAKTDFHGTDYAFMLIPNAPAQQPMMKIGD